MARPFLQLLKWRVQPLLYIYILPPSYSRILDSLDLYLLGEALW